MTYQEYLKQAKERLSETSLEILKSSAREANENLDLDPVILDGILEALEDRMSEDEFVKFCDTL